MQLPSQPAKAPLTAVFVTLVQAEAWKIALFHIRGDEERGARFDPQIFIKLIYSRPMWKLLLCSGNCMQEVAARRANCPGGGVNINYRKSPTHL